MKPTESFRPYERTRNAHKLESTEDYLEAIAEIIAFKEVCRSADLAKRFAVSAVTVHKIVEGLRTLSLVTGDPYHLAEPIAISE